MRIADISLPNRIGPNSNGMLMTPGEFDAIEKWDDNYRDELVHGVLIVTHHRQESARGSRTTYLDTGCG